MKQYAMIENVSFTQIANKDAQKACKGFALALNAIDKEKGKQALYAMALQTMCNSDKLPEFDNNYPRVMYELFGIARSQAFNLAKAGSMLKEGKDEKTGKVYYTDIFTDDFNKKPYSNTALIRIAEFIGNTDDENAEKAQSARMRESFVRESNKKGDISPEMSIAKLSAFLKGYSDKKPIDTSAQNAQNAQNGAQNAQNAQNGAQNAQKTLIDDTQVLIMISDNYLIRNAKIALLKAIEVLDSVGKKAEYPELPTLIELFNEANKNAKKKGVTCLNKEGTYKDGKYISAECIHVETKKK